VIKFLRGGEIVHLVGFGRKGDLARLLHGVSKTLEQNFVTLARRAVKKAPRVVAAPPSIA
jgi:hypothetical protein